jgi:hypothetical protein
MRCNERPVAAVDELGSLGGMRTAFHIPSFLPTNRAAWSIITLLLFSLLWLPAFDFFDFSRGFFDAREGVRVVIPISLALLGVACIVAWCIQGVGIVAFRRWIYPRLERRYGAGVALSHVMSPKRLWAGRWFRRGVFVSAACLTVLLSLCAFFRVWSSADLAAYRGMAAECHPVWRAFAFRAFSRGDSTNALFAKYPPTRREVFGRYGIYRYGDLGFTGFTVIACDGRLLTAVAGSCTWSFTFFETPDAQLDSDYHTYMHERLAKIQQTR